MIIVYTGNGKGKTTAAIGQIIRALGRGWKVCLVQLFKGKEFYGEQKVLKRLKGLDFRSFAPKHPFCFKDISSETASGECAKAVAFLKKLSAGRTKYDLVVLEEFNIACRDNLIKDKVLLDIIKDMGCKSNILITGRGAPKALLKIADLVTEMKEVKHPYNKGIAAQKGIEF
jgi:cob(I)alamin adenosyltransferase